MKIKYYNLLIITPIFFVIALVVSFVDYKDELKELDQGIKSKAKSITIPSKIFIEHMLKNKNLLDISKELEENFNKVIKYKQATRIYISRKGKVLIDTNKDKKYKLKVIRNLDKLRVTDFFAQKDFQLVTIHTPIKSKEGSLILSVDFNPTSFYNEKYIYLMEMILMISLATIFGIITSIILSKIVISKIYKLNADAVAIASGDYTHNSYVENIQEFTDLGDTLNIMKSIMNEIISKTKNAMLKEIKLQDNDDLVDTFHKISDSDEMVSIKNIDLYIKSTGKQEAEYFYESFIYDNKLYAYIGKLESEKSTIESLLNATAIKKYITAHIKNSTLDVLKMSSIFKIDFFELISIDEKNKIKSTLLQEDQKTQSETTIESKMVHFRCMKNSSIKNQIEIYTENYQELTLSTIIDDLENILKNKQFELFILFQKRTQSDSNPMSVQLNN